MTTKKKRRIILLRKVKRPFPIPPNPFLIRLEIMEEGKRRDIAMAKAKPPRGYKRAGFVMNQNGELCLLCHKKGAKKKLIVLHY